MRLGWHCSDTGMIGEGCEVIGEGGIAVCRYDDG